MYLWRKRAATQWFTENEEALRAQAADRLTIIELPGRKRCSLEVACESRRSANRLVRKFGGQIVKLPHNWLRFYSRQQKTMEIQIGKRLVISRSGGLQTAVCCKSATGKSPLLVIPAGAAFGTGEH